MSHLDPEPPSREQPLELILARNLVSIVSLAALLVDVEGRIVFFNDAAAEISIRIPGWIDRLERR